MTGAFLLLMTVVVGPVDNPRSIETYVVDTELTPEDCVELLDAYAPIFLGNNSIGMHCENKEGQSVYYQPLTPQ